MTRHREARGPVVIERRRAQRSFGDGLIAAEVADLHEAWMRQADRILDDPQIVAPVYETLAQRRPRSRASQAVICLPSGLCLPLKSLASHPPMRSFPIGQPLRRQRLSSARRLPAPVHRRTSRAALTTE